MQDPGTQSDNQALCAVHTKLGLLEHLNLKAVESSPFAKVICDSDGKIVVFNQKAELLFGYAMVEVLGKELEMLIPDSMKEKHRNYVLEYMENPHVRSLGTIFVGRNRNGKEFQVEILLSPMVISGAGIFVMATLRRLDKVVEKAVTKGL
jgi:PAS domain S-box-containing protein